MKISRFLTYGGFLLVSTLAQAQISINTSNPGSLLGGVEGIIKFCGQVEPESVYRFEQFDQIFVNGPDKGLITQIRTSDAYKDAFDQVIKQLKALPRDEASDACAGGSSDDDGTANKGKHKGK